MPHADTTGNRFSVSESICPGLPRDEQPLLPPTAQAVEDALDERDAAAACINAEKLLLSRAVEPQSAGNVVRADHEQLNPEMHVRNLVHAAL